MTFGINGAELIILILLAVLVLGPEKLPHYARQLTEWIRNLRRMAEGAKTQFKEETGTDFDEIDWKRYDPRQYDPRRIIRDALSEPVDGDTQGAAAASVSGSSAAPAGSSPTPTSGRDGLRGDLRAARGQRDALREDLKDLDPRALLFGPSSRCPAPGAGAAAAGTGVAAAGAAATAAHGAETTTAPEVAAAETTAPETAETTEADLAAAPSTDGTPAPFDADAT
ncbi:twin-arginine translocase TatA/TatE family subunit [Citricoccus sp. NPDC055426]|uniref:twin-arginine translocase TatA/TatE family subunit n=1 Tax=Citricoccus sp. NPDC055426 TaxID=3155536 RepID=UPI003418C39E